MKKRLPLKVSVSGVRGVVGESLTPQIAARFASAFGTYLGPGQVLVGQDTRPSGNMLKKAVISGLLATGCQPVEVGILPIPTILFLTREKQARGAVVVTASHNPPEWNGLKFIGPEGLYLSRSRVEEFLDIFHQGEFTFVAAERIKTPGQEKNAGQHHLNKILSRLKVRTIRNRRLRVVADCANGAGATLLPQLLRELGCEAMFINTDLGGDFAHQSEPVPENLKELCCRVREFGADLGLAQDADADRLALVDERGRPLGEDLTLALAVSYLLGQKRGPVAVNLSASMAIDDLAARHRVPVIRTRIGEINVVEAMLERGAVIGGEGNGGVIWPEIHPCRDSLAATGLVLEMLASRREKLSTAAAEFKKYHLLKDKMDCPAELAFRAVVELRHRYQSENISTLDGLKISWSDSWVHIRPSNTEPIIRLLAESRSPLRSRRLIENFKKEIKVIIRKLP
ncbi:MAG: phosphoglucosamine mutase [Candidatus Saccharicenans sp.]|nr:phosphoglucosamine mutase [Candidatus Saccharicenans sp.]MDI6849645.1 phosphoglucosamine mutase [Candidatus Saccharicenans sp.]